MKTIDAPAFMDNLAELSELCPDMRLGQLMATLALHADDATNRSLWDIEDDELSNVIERFRLQLVQRLVDNHRNGSHYN